MAFLRVEAEAGPPRLSPALRAALDGVPEGAPVAVLIHGFKFRPGDPGRDPGARLYGDGRGPGWAAGLGFSAEGREDGLCLGFAWDAAARHLPSYARAGCNGFAVAYARAGAAGARLGELIAAMAAARPGLRVDLFAHSLGARVALGALAAPGARRALLLGAAEDSEEAAARMAACPPGREAVHVAARHNDLFDLMFEAAAPRREGGRRARALGREGLPGRADWIDLQLDAPALGAWLAGRGLPLGPAPAVCHWSFYARPGAMALHREMLREPEAWSVAALRAAGVPEGLAAPRWRAAGWTGRLGGGWRRAATRPGAGAQPGALAAGRGARGGQGRDRETMRPRAAE